MLLAVLGISSENSSTGVHKGCGSTVLGRIAYTTPSFFFFGITLKLGVGVSTTVLHGSILPLKTYKSLFPQRIMSNVAAIGHSSARKRIERHAGEVEYHLQMVLAVFRRVVRIRGRLRRPLPTHTRTPRRVNQRENSSTEEPKVNEQKNAPLPHSSLVRAGFVRVYQNDD